MLGKTLSHYEIFEQLGEGGMGVVYKARDTRLNRFVAFKVLPHDKVADPERKRRFIQEAQAASALNHLNIITIHDIGQADGVDFIAMEYVAGKTLDRLIPKNGMRLAEVLKYAIQIANALTRAHAAGIIHRDIKPGNIMVTPEGGVKVLDFGLAKLTERSEEGDATATMHAAPRSEEGTIVGTVAYMSPEQAEGKRSTRAATSSALASCSMKWLQAARRFAAIRKCLLWPRSCIRSQLRCARSRSMHRATSKRSSPAACAKTRIAVTST
jgi:serine/threonine protein kinase